jgi:hypothetical protein
MESVYRQGGAMPSLDSYNLKLQGKYATAINIVITITAMAMAMNLAIIFNSTIVSRHCHCLGSWGG